MSSFQIPEWFYSPDKLILADGSTQQFPYPDLGDAFFNYPNGQGMTYEAQHVRECLQKGNIFSLSKLHLQGEGLSFTWRSLGVMNIHTDLGLGAYYLYVKRFGIKST